jgi:uncharacterized damage-inducible protein DinB
MSSLVTPTSLLEIMEGNRRLTLRTIEAFPEEKLFRYSPVEPLRPFAEMVVEIIQIESAYMRGIATGEWRFPEPVSFSTKQELLTNCEQVRAQTRAWWPSVTLERLLTVEPDPFFGGGPSSMFERLFYALENEIHHRAQGYIYLRELGIEPPAFYER